MFGLFKKEVEPVIDYAQFNRDTIVILELIKEWYLNEKTLDKTEINSQNKIFYKTIKNTDLKLLFSKHYESTFFQLLNMKSSYENSDGRFLDLINTIYMIIAPTTINEYKKRFINYHSYQAKAFDGFASEEDVKHLIELGFDWIWVLPLYQQYTKNL